MDRLGLALRSQVLLVPHHGSRPRRATAFVGAVAPRHGRGAGGLPQPFRPPGARGAGALPGAGRRTAAQRRLRRLELECAGCGAAASARPRAPLLASSGERRPRSRALNDADGPRLAFKPAKPLQEPLVSIHVALNHVTHYRYDRRVGLSPQVVRLRPAPHCRTPILSLLAARRAGRALHQLAAGPVRQLPGAAGLPREDDRVQGHGRPGGRDGGLQPVRLLPRARGRELPLRLRRRS